MNWFKKMEKNKIFIKLGGVRLIFDGEGIVICIKKGGLFWLI